MIFKNLRFGFFAFLLSSASTFAATPLLVYNFGNQIQMSSLAVSSTGNVVRIERTTMNTQTINENPLSGAELVNLKNLIAKVSKGKIVKSIVPAAMGSSAGTISTVVGTKKKDLEGIIRIPTDPSKATRLRNLSPAIVQLKAFIGKYVNVKMP